MKQIHVSNLSTDSLGNYKHAFVCCGYESRSRYIVQERSITAEHIHCFGFISQQELSFDENKRFFATLGIEVLIVTDNGFSDAIEEILCDLESVANNNDVSILVDFSSLPRSRLARLLSAFSSLTSKCDIVVDFLYAIAKYTPPPENPSVVSFAGPVLDLFAGWSAEPEHPVAAVVGLGYEPDKVLGALEYLESPFVSHWIPHGKDLRFLTAIEVANATLLEQVSLERRVTYDPLNPFDTFVRLESFCYGLIASNFRPVIMPFGPKTFSLVSMLVALHWPKEIAVWRISGEHSELPVDRQADGAISGLRVRFSTKQ
jgi:hypothetical protein